MAIDKEEVVNNSTVFSPVVRKNDPTRGTVFQPSSNFAPSFVISLSFFPTRDKNRINA